MSAKITIKDGQSGGSHGPELEACVKDTRNHEHALCMNISGITPRTTLPTFDGPISGSIGVETTLKTSGGQEEMYVDGSVTSVLFRLEADPDFDTIVNEIAFVALDGSIKLGKFLGLNTALANGILFEYKADNALTTRRTLYSTHDLKAMASPGGWDIDAEAAADSVRAVQVQQIPFIIRQQGTFGASSGDDDYIQVTIQDDLDTVESLICIIRGIKIEAGTL